MRIVNSDVTVEVPASCANLGPGFDSLGLAVSLYDRIKVRATVGKTKVHISGQGEKDLPRDDSHLVVQTLRATLDLVGAPQIGIEMWCHNRIPQSRGLGSSAAAIVGGLALARGLVDEPEALDQEMMLKVATAIEGHPDNLAPAIYGGITASGFREGQDFPRETTTGQPVDSPFVDGPASPEMADDEYLQRRQTLQLLGLDGQEDQEDLYTPQLVDRIPPVWCVPIEAKSELKVTVFVPSFKLDTAQARGLLPDLVPHREAAMNSANAALLVLALQGHPELLHLATREYLHQEYRRPAMPASMDLVDWLRRRDYPAVISGAGPTVLVLQEVPPSVQFQARNGGWDAKVMPLDMVGVRQV